MVSRTAEYAGRTARRRSDGADLSETEVFRTCSLEACEMDVASSEVCSERGVTQEGACFRATGLSCFFLFFFFLNLGVIIFPIFLRECQR